MYFFVSLLHYYSKAHNELTGTIPSEIGLLSNLKGLFQVRANDFTGLIPTEIGLLTGVANFDFSKFELASLFVR